MIQWFAALIYQENSPAGDVVHRDSLADTALAAASDTSRAQVRALPLAEDPDRLEASAEVVDAPLVDEGEPAATPLPSQRASERRVPASVGRRSPRAARAGSSAPPCRRGFQAPARVGRAHFGQAPTAGAARGGGPSAPSSHSPSGEEVAWPPSAAAR